MQNAAPALSTPQTDADYERLAEELLAQLRDINAHMDADRAEINRLAAETDALKSETRAILASISAQYKTGR